MGAMMNEDRWAVINFTYDPASIPAATTAEQTITIPGLKVGDYVADVGKPTHTAGVGIINCRVSTANTLAVTWINATAAAVDPPSELYSVYVLRPEKVFVGSFNP
jgi:hypothetical protein